MLPGIRFVCAAIVFAVSLVIFGMGAAALLRSAHEEFASLPNRRPPPATVFSRQPEPTPTLAMLRLEPHATDLGEPVASAPVVQATQPTPPAEPIAAEAATAPEAIAVVTAAPMAEPENPAMIEAAPPQSSEPATIVAAVPVENSEPVTAARQAIPAPESTASISLPTATIMELPTATLTAEDAQLSSSKAAVAVLGGPPIDTAPVPLPNARPTAEPPKAKPAKVVKKKPAAKRARMAARMTTAAPAPIAQQQQQFDPLGLSQLR